MQSKIEINNMDRCNSRNSIKLNTKILLLLFIILEFKLLELQNKPVRITFQKFPNTDWSSDKRPYE